MATTITLSWDGNTLTASPTAISAPQNSSFGLTWATGTGVKSIDNVTAPTSVRGSLPTPAENNGVWTGTDNMGTSTNTYTYTVTFEEIGRAHV